MTQMMQENGGTPAFEPMRPGLALKIIFEKNMGLTLDYVSRASGIDREILGKIADDQIPIDEEAGHKLKTAFGDTGTTLVRMQFAYDYFKKHGALPPLEQVYSL